MDFFKNKTASTVLFSSLPKKEVICCVVGYVKYSEKCDSSAKSKYHWQILRCRQLIFSEPEIIASPASGEDGAIYIIMTDEYYKTGKLQLHLEKLSMTWGSPEAVSNITYEACFRYTLIARISPLWNQVDCYLIQGRDFLLNASPMNAIKFELIARDENVFLSVWPIQIRLSCLLKSHVDVEHNREDKWVHVLPSLKKARIMSVSPHIPVSCPFRTYREIKRHWKNMYGYRLPDTPDQLFFCSLSFQSFSPTLYTYPSLCVRPQGLFFLRHMDNMGVLQVFLADIATKLPAMCGQPLGTESHVLYAVPRLYHSSESLEYANLSALSEHLPARKSEVLSSISKAEILSSESFAVDSLGSSCNFLARCQSQTEVLSSESCAAAGAMGSEDILKGQKKLCPVFKPRTCPPVSYVMPESRGPSPHGTFQSLSCGDLDSVTLPSKVEGGKKPRSRPQVQPDVDVEALARNRDLSRVNAVTLVSWLRAKNVPCKVKDRKSVLIEKVMIQLNLQL
ncbi:uncharacterized protein C18orf63 isoform X2 [Cryptotermes secundus]|uniref:uncharacterized protein C18orf63 isoform X2 n=1 Tax=Cryptotermes secundus TaxID=105785 RepID=UPI000CD7D8F3|nr:uncharacterized protein C18orf63 isoform X2 [Cryptotermes secundus]